ncbi:NUDIX domain-containing protein [Paenisporosarcina quisquiliarum]|nr:NUDIX domain-containing protein [Paenisporosarcina quisquiliarum]
MGVKLLTKIDALPTDKKIAGVHCVPFTENGNILMSWDRDEQLLTTIGGRLEGNESIDQALEREAMEEVGILLEEEKIPFALWYWDSTDSYTIWFLAKVKKMEPYSFDFEKTGYVSFNFETALQLIEKIEPNNPKRTNLIKLAEESAKEHNWL